MRRKENISFYILFSIIIGGAAGLALGVAFDKIIMLTACGAVLGLVIGLFTANDKRVVASKTSSAPKKTTTKKTTKKSTKKTTKK